MIKATDGDIPFNRACSSYEASVGQDGWRAKSERLIEYAKRRM